MKGLKEVLESRGSLADAPAPTIEQFSSGFRGNGIGRIMNVAPPRMQVKAANDKKHKSPKEKKPKKGTARKRKQFHDNYEEEANKPNPKRNMRHRCD